MAMFTWLPNYHVNKQQNRKKTYLTYIFVTYFKTVISGIAYMSQTCDQQMAADWHYPGALYCRSLPALANNCTTVQHADIPPPKSATQSLHPIAYKLSLIARDGRLS